MPRAKGSKNRRTLERETANRIAAAHAEMVKSAPPLDFSMPLDSFDVMEQAMRYFYFRAKIEERLGDGADLRRVDDALCGPCTWPRRWRAIGMPNSSAVKQAGDINAGNYNDATLDELLAKIRVELVKLGPLIDLDSIREPQGVENSFAGDRQRERTRGDFAATPAAAGHGCFIRVERRNHRGRCGGSRVTLF